MFDSLQAIARDTSSQQQAGSKDDDDKEQLNSHISMIENMHYYRECVESHGLLVLNDSKAKAGLLFEEHLASYLKAVVRRPLGKLLVTSIALHLTFRISYTVLRHLSFQIRRRMLPLGFHSRSQHSKRSSPILTPRRFGRGSIFSTSELTNILVTSPMKVMQSTPHEDQQLRRHWSAKYGGSVKRSTSVS